MYPADGPIEIRLVNRHFHNVEKIEAAEKAFQKLIVLKRSLRNKGDSSSTSGTRLRTRSGDPRGAATRRGLRRIPPPWFSGNPSMQRKPRSRQKKNEDEEREAEDDCHFGSSLGLARPHRFLEYLRATRRAVPHIIVERVAQREPYPRS